MSRHPRSIAPSILLLLGACPGGAGTLESTSEGTTRATGGVEVPMTDTSADDSGSETTAAPTTTSASESSGPTTGGLDCSLHEIEFEVQIPRVMLVLDKSRSMIADPDGYWDADADDADDDGIVDGDPDMKPATPRITRWSSLHAVVDSIVTGFEPRMDFGAVLFPSTAAKSAYDASACPVHPEPEVPVGADQGATILATIPGPEAFNLNGGTPAAAGITTAIAALPRNEQLSVEQDPRYIVLVTDGAANCAADAASDAERFEVYDAHLPEVVSDALQAGIPTFVVGIDIEDEVSELLEDGVPDGVNTHEKLNELAEIGGQARDGAEKFYNAGNQLELQAALESISQAITSCTLEFTIGPVLYQYIDEVIVQTSGAPLEYDHTQVGDCATESGWRFTDESRKSIELCGDACSAYQAHGDVAVQVQCVGGR